MTDVLETLKKLPELCYTVLKSDPNQLIAIKRGVVGYYPIHKPLPFNTAAKEWAKKLNGDAVTTEQVEAMENGSMFGWEVPGADPDFVREQWAKVAARKAAKEGA